MTSKMSPSARKDRAVLTLAEDSACTITRLDLRAGKAARVRAQRQGWIGPHPEYSDCVRLTCDGEDYLGILRELYGDAEPAELARASV